MRVNRAFVSFERIAQCLIEQLQTRERPTWVLHQHREQIKFGRREIERAHIRAREMLVEVNRQITGGVRLRACRCAFGAAQNRAHARNHFARTERFDDLIVRAEFQTDQPIRFFDARGNHNHRCGGLFANRAANVETVHSRQIEIEQNERGIFVAKHRERVRAIRCGRDHEAGLFQVSFQNADEFFFVFDDQNFFAHWIKIILPQKNTKITGEIIFCVLSWLI